MGIFAWAVRSQGLEPSTKCFCSMHELLYETKATGKEQYHNNFGCYGFIEFMAKTNTEKITKEMQEGLFEDTGDSDSYDVESGDEDSEDRPWRPSHFVFGKSTIK